MKLPSIQQMVEEASRAAVRFPFVLLAASIGTAAAIVGIEHEPVESSSITYPIMLASALGILLQLALALAGEKWKWPRPTRLGAQLVGVILLVAYGLSIPASLPHEPAFYTIRFALLLTGLALLIMVLPYLKRGELNGFWQFNKAIYFRLFVTGIFAAVLYAGLAIALAALENLFGVDVPGKRYFELWVLIAGLFSPWFFLAGLPTDLDALDRVEEYPKGLKMFAQYILLSLVLVYLVILYAYLFKILLQWNWPKGWVSSLILGFSAVAILAALLLHPVRETTGNAWIKAYSKWLYVALIPLIVVLFLAVFERVGDYGITEPRYAGIVLGLWLTAQVIYFLFSKAKSIKFTVGSLGVLAFLVCVGPWSMFSVAEGNQVGRLEQLLNRNRILVNGQVTGDHEKISHEDAQQISSIVSYLYEIHGYDRIQPWFAVSLRNDTATTFSRYLPPSEVMEKMGVDFVRYWREGRGTMFSIGDTLPLDIAGYDHMLTQRHSGATVDKPAPQPCGEGVSFVCDDSLRTMTLLFGDSLSGFDTVRVDLRAFADTLLRDYGEADYKQISRMSPETMSLAAEQSGRKVKLFFRHLHLTRQEEATTISSYTVDIAYTDRR